MTRFISTCCQGTAVAITALPLVAAIAGCSPPAGSLSATAAGEADGQTVRHQAADPRADAPRGMVAPASGRDGQRSPRQPAKGLVPAGSHDVKLKPVTKRKDVHAMTISRTQPATPGKVHHVSANRFSQDVLQADVPVLVDFYADWCGPCRMLAPVLDQVAREMPQAKVVKVNIDENPQLAAQYGVSAIPTVLVFRGGQAVAQHTGLADRQTLQNLLGR